MRSMRITILEAAAQVVGEASHPLTAKQIHERIVAKELFAFKARDAVGVLRASIRKHVRTHGGPGQPPARLKLVGRDQFGPP